MPRYVAFLRGINVGGHVVRMDTLRELFESLRLASVETFIASGNIVFESRAGDRQALTVKIERAVERALGYEVATFLRTDVEVARIAASPYWKSARARSAVARNVGFLPRAPGAAAKRALRGLVSEIDDFQLTGRELFWVSRALLSESEFSYALFEKMLRVRATFRNLNTVARLAAKYPPAS